MFRSWRLQLREADEAFRAGQLDEAERLLREGNLSRYLPGKKLAAEVADAIARRGRLRFLAGESEAGWRDLERACTLGGESERVLVVKQEMIGQALRDSENRLVAGDTGAVIGRLESLRKRHPDNEAVATLLEVARRLESARNLSRRGKFSDAEPQLASAAALRPDLAVVGQRLDACREDLRSSRELGEQLHQALAAEDWSQTLALADRLLELAPESPLAQDARRRAWREVGTSAPEFKRLDVTQEWTPPSSDTGRGESNATVRTRPVECGVRYLLWIDGVGGYLVCLADQVSIGQAAPGNRVDIPIQGNLSRTHALLRREDGYLIEPLEGVRMDGEQIRETTLLSDGDEFELGDGVRLRFRQPHALSATARLDFVSRHRTHPWADGVLLMAESCVLGPKWQNHVVCQEWTSDVVLYRRDGDLFCRAMEPIEVDGQYCDGQAHIGPNCHVTGGDFSLCLEGVA